MDENSFVAEVSKLADCMASEKKIFGAGFGVNSPTKDQRVASSEAWDLLSVELVVLCAEFFNQFGSDRACPIFMKAVRVIISKHGSDVHSHRLVDDPMFSIAILNAATRK